MPQFLAHTMKSPLPSSMRAGGPPGTRPWGFALPLQSCGAPAPVRPGRHRHSSKNIAATEGINQPTVSTLSRAIQRRSYAIASLQQKLDAQRAQNLDLQTNYKKLQLTLDTFLDMWNAIKKVPLPTNESQQTSQCPSRNATHPPEQQPHSAASEHHPPINKEPCPCPSSPHDVLAEHHPPINVQSSACPASPLDLLLAEHLPPTSQSINAATPTSPSLPTAPQPTLSPQPSEAASAAGSVQANTHPAAQQTSVLPFSPARQRFGKKHKRKNNPVNQRMPQLDTWFQGFSSLPVKPLRHGPMWEAPESTVVYHTCAPPPGWKTANGITVPPSHTPMVDTQPTATREDGDDDLGVWFCTKCYLDPMEKPPDFEMCSSCAENYYFPYPPTLTRDWVCQGCYDLCKGRSSAYRHCYCCGRTEEFTMQDINELF